MLTAPYSLKESLGCLFFFLVLSIYKNYTIKLIMHQKCDCKFITFFSDYGGIIENIILYAMFKTSSSYLNIHVHVLLVCTLKFYLFPSLTLCKCLPNFVSFTTKEFLLNISLLTIAYTRCMNYLQDCLGPGEDIFASRGGRVPEMWVGGSRVCQNFHTTYSIVQD